MFDVDALTMLRDHDCFLRSSDSLALVDRFFQRSATCTETAERAVRKRRIPVEESAPHRGDRVQRIRTLIRLRRSRYDGSVRYCGILQQSFQLLRVLLHFEGFNT